MAGSFSVHPFHLRCVREVASLCVEKAWRFRCVSWKGSWSCQLHPRPRRTSICYGWVGRALLWARLSLLRKRYPFAFQRMRWMMRSVAVVVALTVPWFLRKVMSLSLYCSWAPSVCSFLTFKLHAIWNITRALSITLDASDLFIIAAPVVHPVPASTISCRYLYPQTSAWIIGPVASDDTASSGAYRLAAFGVNRSLFVWVAMHAGNDSESSPLLFMYLIASGNSYANWLMTSGDLWFMVLCIDALPIAGAIAGAAWLLFFPLTVCQVFQLGVDSFKSL